LELKMVNSLACEKIIDCQAEPLGASWLRRYPTAAETKEQLGAEVFRTGPEGLFRNALVQSLNDASEVALVCSFLLADKSLAAAILDAAQRGVRVYVLTASEHRVTKAPADDDQFEQRMVEEHKQLLAQLAGKVVLRSAEHLHAKFLVVDPGNPHKAHAWLSTANFNKALVDSIELGVKLLGNDARALAEHFQWAFWCETQHELQGKNRLSSVNPMQPAAPPKPASDTVIATLKDSWHLRQCVVGMIQAARQEILVSSYGIAADHAAMDALVQAAQRGVQVTLLTRPRPAVAPAVARLASIPGTSILAHDKLHAKALVVDGKVLVMSANLETHGLDSGFEVGVLLSPQPSSLVEMTLRDWAKTFPWVYAAAAQRGDHLGDFCPAESPLRDVKTVTALWAMPALPPIVATDALKLQEAPQPNIQTPKPPANQLPQQVKVSWTVQAPRLPKDAVERLQESEKEEKAPDGKVKKIQIRVPHEPRLFDHRGQTYVLFSQLDQESHVRQRAAELNARVVLL
jgi:cardiolipin synthase